MIEINEYSRIKQVNDLKLKIFLCGRACVDNSWSGKVNCSAVSRLYYVKKGSFFLVKNGQRIDFAEGGWYLIPSGSSYEYGCDSEMEQLFFHFNLSGCENVDLFERKSSILILKDNSETMGEIIEFLKCDNDTSMLCVKSAVLKILLKMMKEYEIDLSSNKYSPCVVKAINYIEQNLSENLTIKNISEAIFVSESTLTKHMQKELGTTVNKYVDDLILTRSAQMIIEGRCSLNEISNRFCFCDQFYFSRKFKKKFGVTPSEYRKSHGI